MSKGHKHSPVQAEAARFNDTTVRESYAIMDELRRGMTLKGYVVRSPVSKNLTLILQYKTVDGKVHELTSLEVEV